MDRYWTRLSTNVRGDEADLRERYHICDATGVLLITTAPTAEEAWRRALAYRDEVPTRTAEIWDMEGRGGDGLIVGRIKASRRPRPTVFPRPRSTSPDRG